MDLLNRYQMTTITYSCAKENSLDALRGRVALALIFENKDLGVIQKDIMHIMLFIQKHARHTRMKMNGLLSFTIQIMRVQMYQR